MKSFHQNCVKKTGGYDSKCYIDVMYDVLDKKEI